MGTDADDHFWPQGEGSSAMMTDCRSILADEFRANRAAICHVFIWTKRSRFPELRDGNTLGLAAAPNAFERELGIRIKLDKDTHIDMSSGGYQILLACFRWVGFVLSPYSENTPYFALLFRTEFMIFTVIFSASPANP